jgi:hypothetical protein
VYAKKSVLEAVKGAAKRRDVKYQSLINDVLRRQFMRVPQMAPFIDPSELLVSVNESSLDEIVLKPEVPSYFIQLVDELRSISERVEELEEHKKAKKA